MFSWGERENAAGEEKEVGGESCGITGAPGGEKVRLSARSEYDLAAANKDGLTIWGKRGCADAL